MPVYPAFDPEEDPATLPERWEEWLDGLETMIDAMRITDHEHKFSLLKHYGGGKIRNVEKQLEYDKALKYGDDPTTAVADHYRRLKEALTGQFAPSRNATFAEYEFHSMNQEEEETIDTYTTRLRKQAKLCGFCDKACQDRAIKNRIVAGCRSHRLRRKALETDVTLVRLLEIARAEEKSNEKAEKMEKPREQSETVDVNKVKRHPSKYSAKTNFTKNNNIDKYDSSPNPPVRDKKCFYCGGKYPHAKGKSGCPAYGKKCINCGRMNHFASHCKDRQKVNFVEEDDDSDNDQYINLGRVMMLDSVLVIGGVANKNNCVSVGLNEKSVQMYPDTGADATLIDVSIYNQIKPKPRLHDTRAKLLPYGAKIEEPIKLRGCFWAEIKWGDRQVQEKVYVSECDNRGLSLLSKKASLALGIVTINLEPPTPTVNLVKESTQDGTNDHPFLKEFPNICKGLGKRKDFQVSFTLKDNAKPSVAKPSRIPFNLQDKVKAELDRLTALDVLKKSRLMTVSGSVV